MNDSQIIYDRNGDARVFEGPDAVQCYRAAALASGINMMVSTGGKLKPARGWTWKLALANATAITQKPYTRATAPQAVADLKAWVQEMKAALPSRTTEGAPL